MAADLRHAQPAEAGRGRLATGRDLRRGRRGAYWGLEKPKEPFFETKIRHRPKKGRSIASRRCITTPAKGYPDKLLEEDFESGCPKMAIVREGAGDAKSAHHHERNLIDNAGIGSITLAVGRPRRLPIGFRGKD
jgi:hypothetical protein